MQANREQLLNTPVVHEFINCFADMLDGTSVAGKLVAQRNYRRNLCFTRHCDVGVT